MVVKIVFLQAVTPESGLYGSILIFQIGLQFLSTGISMICFRMCDFIILICFLLFLFLWTFPISSNELLLNLFRAIRLSVSSDREYPYHRTKYLVALCFFIWCILPLTVFLQSVI